MGKISFCVANWKMNKNFNESIDYLEKLKTLDLSAGQSNMIICPSYLDLHELIKYKKAIKDIDFGSQNVSCEIKGSFTGEISVSMLESVGCSWVIIGHSERRAVLKETDLDISKKMKLVYNSKINPILCIGETLLEREKKETPLVLKRQIVTAFKEVDFKKNKTILIAYEPIWAIGTGEAANITDIDKNIKIIKNIINDINTKDCNICLLYGGSVDVNNAADIFNIKDVSGFLIGTSSLTVENFYDIYRQI